MELARIREKILSLAGALSELNIDSLSVFGSVAKGVAKDTSDVDFLVQFHGPATFDRYMSLKELLERELECSVDLVTVRALKPLLRDQIVEEAIRVA